MTDAQGHTFRTPEEELIAALREELRCTARLNRTRPGVGDNDFDGDDWDRASDALDRARYRVVLADRALVAAPKVRRVEAEMQEMWTEDDGRTYLMLLLPLGEDLRDCSEDTRAVLLVPETP